MPMRSMITPLSMTLTVGCCGTISMATLKRIRSTVGPPAGGSWVTECALIQRHSSTSERSDVDEWRWMSAHSVTQLPPAGGPTVLRIRFSVAIEIVPQHPTVRVMLNGVIIDRIGISEEHNERHYDVTP